MAGLPGTARMAIIGAGAAATSCLNHVERSGWTRPAACCSAELCRGLSSHQIQPNIHTIAGVVQTAACVVEAARAFRRKMAGRCQDRSSAGGDVSLQRRRRQAPVRESRGLQPFALPGRVPGSGDRGHGTILEVVLDAIGHRSSVPGAGTNVQTLTRGGLLTFVVVPDTDTAHNLTPPMFRSRSPSPVD